MAIKKYLSAFLILVILTTSIYIMMPDKVKIVVEKTRTKYYVWEDESWTLGATEYLNLFDGVVKMRAKSREVITGTEGNITKIIRLSQWKDNITTIQTYTFDSTIEDVELVPIDNKLECFNCGDKIVHYEYRNILYEGETKYITSPFSFGHQMKLEWQDGYEWAKVYQQKVASDKIIIRYKPQSDYETYRVRLFDPSVNCSPPDSGDWNITLDVICENEDITINESAILVSGTAKFTLINSNLTLIVADSGDIINVSENANFTSQNSRIESSSGDQFNLNIYGYGDLSNTILNESRLYIYGNKTHIIVSSTFYNYIYLEENSMSNINDSFFYSIFFARGFSNAIIENSLFYALLQPYQDSYLEIKNSTLTNITLANDAILNFTSPSSNITTYFKASTAATVKLYGDVYMPPTGQIASGSLMRYYPIRIVYTNTDIGIANKTANITNSTGALVWANQTDATGWVIANLTLNSTNYGEGNFTISVNPSQNISLLTDTPITMAVNAPPVPTLNSPANETAQVHLTDWILLNATCTDANGDDGTPLFYAGTSANPTTNIGNGSEVSSGSSSTYNYTGLSTNVYYWRAKCMDNESYLSVYSEERWFNITNIAPNTPTLNSPANETSNYETLWVYLNATCTDPEGDNVTVIFYAGTDSNPTTNIGNSSEFISGGSGTYNYTGLVIDTYYWRAKCWDGTNFSMNYSEERWFDVGCIALDGLCENRTYEYGTESNISVNVEGLDNICLDIYMLGYGLNYTCGNDTVNLTINLENYTVVDYFFDLATDSLLKFRDLIYDYIYVDLPNYLDFYEASIDVTGIYPDEEITRFDSWNESQTEEDYEWSGVNQSKILNMTFRTSREVTQAYFKVQSPDGAYNLKVDLCNDGIYEFDNIGYYYTWTTVEFDISDVNDCLANLSSDSYNRAVMPLNITFEGGGNVSIKDVFFERNTVYYPSNLEIDVGNDTYIDIELPGDISTAGETNIFNDGTTSKTKETTNSSNVEETYYTELPRGLTITSSTISIDTEPYNDTVIENFCNTDLTDVGNTTAVINTAFCQLQNQMSGDSPFEGWYYTTTLYTADSNFTTATLTASYDTMANAKAYFYMSPDNGVNWELVTSGTEHTFTAQGNELKVRIRLTSDGTDRANVQSYTLSGLGTYPSNISFDWDGDGDWDWDYTGEYSGGPETITITPSDITDVLSTCLTSLCDVPMIINFTGPGNLTLQAPDIDYSLGGIVLPTTAIQAYISNDLLSNTNITTFNDTTSSKVISPVGNQTVYIELIRESIIDLLQLNITGEYYK